VNSRWLVVWYQLSGILVFTVGTIVLGIALRRRPETRFAERISRVSHLLYWVCLGLPSVLGVLYPGLTHFDELVGLRPLPYRTATSIVGVLLLIPGIYLFYVANAALKRIGQGAAAFKLTKTMVQSTVYRKMRNPMSLGYYLISAAISLLAGSTYLTCLTVLLLIPAHAYNLKYFEEVELEVRYGDIYGEYKRRVPFLIPWFRSGGA
jgi:protein-S-isoprenylcysteine O-methyltransferase Ste14